MGTDPRETVVDPPLFRLRAFEVDWVAPITKRRGDPLAELLLAEAYLWIVLSQRVGFFPEGVAPPADLGSISDDVRSLLEREVREEPNVDAEAVARHLAAAQEDLTQERWEFLRTIIFADDVEWHARLDRALNVADSLANESAESVSAAALDEAAWLLEGRTSSIRADAAWPSHWRSNELPILLMISPHNGVRLDEADAWRFRQMPRVPRRSQFDAEMDIPSGSGIESGTW